MEEGIFRKSGSQSDIMELKEAIVQNNGILTAEMLLETADCHNITGNLQ